MVFCHFNFHFFYSLERINMFSFFFTDRLSLFYCNLFFRSLVHFSNDFLENFIDQMSFFRFKDNNSFLSQELLNNTQLKNEMKNIYTKVIKTSNFTEPHVVR